MTRLLSALVALLVSAGASAAPPAPPAVRIVDADPMPITIEANKGQLLRLIRPVDTVFIAEPEIADVQLKSPTLLYVYGRQTGETTLFAVDQREIVVLNRRVVVSHNLQRLREVFTKFQPHADVGVDSLGSAVVLTGVVANAQTSDDLRSLAERVLGKGGQVVNRLQVNGPNQVNLRVRVAEVSRELSKQLGINWDVAYSTGSFVFGLVTGNPLGAVGAAAALEPTSSSAFLSGSPGRFDVNALIDALDDEGLITVLAEPNLTAMTGETASFLAGGEFPIPVAQDENTISVVFKKFGVSLAFTPTVLSDGKINMRVRPEVSQLSTAGAVEISGFSVPALTTRRAETTIELGSGQSFAVAGLLESTTNQTVEEYPGLAELPIIGPLFRSTRFVKRESELVIIVTPYLVRPVNTQLAAPTDGFVPPSDAERILSGATSKSRSPGVDGALVARDGATLVGPAGFVLD